MIEYKGMNSRPTEALASARNFDGNLLLPDNIKHPELNTIIDKFKINNRDRVAAFSYIVINIDKLSNLASLLLSDPSHQNQTELDKLYAAYNKITSIQYYPIWRSAYEALTDQSDPDNNIARGAYSDLVISKDRSISAALDQVKQRIEQNQAAINQVNQVDPLPGANKFNIDGLNFAHSLDHPDTDAYKDHFFEMFDNVIYAISKEKDTPERKEKMLYVLEQFINNSNRLMVSFFRSNSSMDKETSGYMKFLLPFARAEGSDRKPTEHGVVQNLEKFLSDVLSPGESKYWLKRLGSQGLEMLHSTYLDSLGREKASIVSMASDYEELKTLDVGEKNKSGDQDYNINNTFDFFTHYNKEQGKDLVYQHARTMRLIMFMQPFLITDFEAEFNGGWDHADSGGTRERFDEFTNLFVEYFTYLIAHKQAVIDFGENSEEEKETKKKLDTFLIKSGNKLTDIFGLEKPKAIEKEKNYFSVFEKRYNKYLVDTNERFIKRYPKKIRDQKRKENIEGKEFISVKDGKVTITLAREEDFLSEGKDEVIIFSNEDIATLLDEADENKYQRRIIQFLAGRMGTAVGVGLHNFNTKYSLGATPPGAIATFSRMMKALNPFGAANYSCYKGVRPHPQSMYFEVEINAEKMGDLLIDDQTRRLLTNEDAELLRILENGEIENHVLTQEQVTLLEEARLNPNFKEIPGKFENLSNILISQGLTKMVNEAISGVVRKYKIKLGSLNSIYDHIETAYPDAYSFVILASRSRQKEGTGFDAWWTGFTRFEEFALKTDAVPGGSLDFDAIKKKDPEKFRAELFTSLKDIIQQSFSPMKASLPWFRWEHIAQDLIMYIDKMYKVYRICDDSHDGLIYFTDGIRKTLEDDSANMSGMGATSYESKQIRNTRKYKVNRGLVASFMLSQGKDFYDCKDILSDDGFMSEDEYKKGRQNELYYKAISAGEQNQVRGVNSLISKELLPQFKGKTKEKAELPDIRDYILNFTPRAKVNSKLGKAITKSLNEARLDPDAHRIAQTQPFFGGKQLLRNRMSSIKRKLFELENKAKAAVLEKQINMAIFGVPEEAKK